MLFNWGVEGLEGSRKLLSRKKLAAAQLQDWASDRYGVLLWTRRIMSDANKHIIKMGWVKSYLRKYVTLVMMSFMGEAWDNTMAPNTTDIVRLIANAWYRKFLTIFLTSFIRYLQREGESSF